MLKDCSVFPDLSLVADNTRDEDDCEGIQVSSEIGASKNSSQIGNA